MRLTRRGRIVLIYTPITIVVIAALVWIACNVWYVPGRGYCIGTMLECYADSFH